VSGIEDLLRDAYQEAARSVRPEQLRPAVILSRGSGRQWPRAVRGRKRWSAFVPLRRPRLSPS
jgi:hypothetical protein